MTEFYPIRLKPIYKEYVWGGEKIAKRYSRKSAPIICAESWEVSDRSDGMSVILNGEYKGWTLHKLIRKMGKQLLGSKIHSMRFPLLIKLIDAAQNLSVQVHPNDKDAALLGSEAKTECWVILAASDDAAVYVGLDGKLSEKKLEQLLQDEQIVDRLKKIAVAAGDVIYVPGGCIHAICSGCLLLEVQQNSNTTYRIYDWGRGRQLHLEEAKQVITTSTAKSGKRQPQPIPADADRSLLIDSPYFRIEDIRIIGRKILAVSEESFEVLFCIEGSGDIEIQGNIEKYREGESFLAPAMSKEIALVSNKKSHFLRITL